MQNNQYQFPKSGLIRKPQVLAFLSISNSAFYERIKKGEIPKPTKIGKCSGWRAEDIRRIAGYSDLEV